ncbi:uncharacterized protein [Panulirus ornatus]|uniref:uncharacterized protein n=1 Tax=Panulirus ornatus TaxID=150431 RepID=UPI003A8B8FB3
MKRLILLLLALSATLASRFVYDGPSGPMSDFAPDDITRNLMMKDDVSDSSDDDSDDSDDEDSSASSSSDSEALDAMVDVSDISRDSGDDSHDSDEYEDSNTSSRIKGDIIESTAKHSRHHHHHASNSHSMYEGDYDDM